MLELTLLFVAGIVGGIVNSIAGGGSFITFPALMFAGVPAIAANATNTFAALAGYVSGTIALRESLRPHRAQLPYYIVMSAIGGLIGAWLLMRTPNTVFSEAVPWLLLFATALFAFGARIRAAVIQVAAHFNQTQKKSNTALLGQLVLAMILLLVCIYGGFFNAGLGIMALSYLAIAGMKDINAMNGIKLLISSTLSIVALLLFINNGMIAWREGVAVLLGTLVGGYFAAHVSTRMPAQWINAAIIIAGCGISAYYFYDVYAAG